MSEINTDQIPEQICTLKSFPTPVTVMLNYSGVDDKVLFVCFFYFLFISFYFICFLRFFFNLLIN